MYDVYPPDPPTFIKLPISTDRRNVSEVKIYFLNYAAWSLLVYTNRVQKSKFKLLPEL